uniref:Protein phosphatase n=1 Tax=Noccaea caerulescens TaxID=107243 RepID=A0A1J3G3J4_NOCCA
MAEHLILSLQPPPFLIFPSSLHRRLSFSRRFPGGDRFTVPEFRLSSQLQLANSTSPSQSSSSPSFPQPDSAPEKFDLVSSTQLKDGSHVFRFGDASEIERNRETEEKARCLEVEKQHAKIAEEASELSRKQGVKDGHALSDLDLVSQLEGPKEKSDAKKKSDTETGGSEKEESSSPPANLSNVIKIKDRKRVRSPTKKKKETLRSQDKVEAKIASVSNLSSIASVAEAIPITSTEEKVAVSKKSESIIENVEPLSSEVMGKVSVNEIRDCETNSYQQLTEDRVEVQARPIPQDGSQSQLYDLKEVVHVSTIEPDDNLDVSENPTKTFESGENLVVEPTAIAAVSPDELISTSEATHSSVDEIAETPVVDTSEVANDGGNVASTTEDEITVSDTKADNGSLSETVDDSKSEDIQLPAPETVGLESIEVVSVREELVSKAFYLDSGFDSLQSPVKALAGREDAYFVSNHNWLGIADGVSQWSLEGVIRGTYAQELMSNCQKIISDETDKITDPVQVLHKSAKETKSPGSSTALIAHLHNNELHIANIGDSGVMVIRNGTVLQKSSPMFHHFCFPLQIRPGDDDVLKLAGVYHVNLEEGDVVITATDGLFDNLYEKEIVSIVCRSLEQSLEPQKVAELLAAKAQEVGRSEIERTPFADAAKEEGYDGYKGGKLDAVTVIVSLVKTLSV